MCSNFSVKISFNNFYIVDKYGIFIFLAPDMPKKAVDDVGGGNGFTPTCRFSRLKTQIWKFVKFFLNKTQVTKPILEKSCYKVSKVSEGACVYSLLFSLKKRV